MKKYLVFFILAIFSYAYEIKLDASISALKYDQNTLYIGTDRGEILKLNLNNKELKNILKLKNIENFFEKNLGARIYSIDIYEDALLIVSEGDFGTQNISIVKNNSIKTHKLPFANTKKAFFISPNSALIVAMGSNIKLIDLNNINVIKKFKFSHYILNDAMMDKDKNILSAAFESGELKLFDIKKWQVFKTYNKIHKDFLYKIDFKNHSILSCGNDKKLGLVKNDTQSSLQNPYIIYTCSLNDKGNLIAYNTFTKNNQNIIRILDTNFNIIKTFDDIPLSAEFLIFLDDKRLLIAGYNKIIIKEI